MEFGHHGELGNGGSIRIRTRAGGNRTFRLRVQQMPGGVNRQVVRGDGDDDRGEDDNGSLLAEFAPEPLTARLTVQGQCWQKQDLRKTRTGITRALLTCSGDTPGDGFVDRVCRDRVSAGNVS